MAAQSAVGLPVAGACQDLREITRLCGFVPLAIGMAARQLYHHPAWTIAGRAAELSAAVDRVGQLATGNLSAAAAFDLSCQDLTAEQQRLHPPARPAPRNRH